jgi:hypothetical protein
MKHNLTLSYRVLFIAFAISILLLGQFHYIEQSEARAVESSSASNASLQDLCAATADLRGSIRTASDYTATLTSPASSVAAIAQALGEATESLEDVRQIVRQILGPC